MELINLDDNEFKQLVSKYCVLCRGDTCSPAQVGACTRYEFEIRIELLAQCIETKVLVFEKSEQKRLVAIEKIQTFAESADTRLTRANLPSSSECARM